MATAMGGDQRTNSSTRMTAPLVSIIIPTYNYSHFITEALDCVSAQTYTHWECIIIDDGSTDDTAKIVAHYMQAKPAQCYHYVKTERIGVSQARNLGIARAKGRYLQFLDADDLISKRKLQIQVEKLAGAEKALVFSASRFFSVDQGQRTYVQKYPKGFLATETLMGDHLLHRIVKNNPFPICSVLVPKELVVQAQLFNPLCNHNEDWLLWFCIALLQPVFLFDHSPKSFAEIRQHGHNTMLDKMKMFEAEQWVRLEMERRLSAAKASGKLMTYNQDLLALHQVRSLSLRQGMRYVIRRLVSSPGKGLTLFFRALYKLMGRSVDQKTWKIRSSS